MSRRGRGQEPQDGQPEQLNQTPPPPAAPPHSPHAALEAAQQHEHDRQVAAEGAAHATMHVLKSISGGNPAALQAMLDSGQLPGPIQDAGIGVPPQYGSTSPNLDRQQRPGWYPAAGEERLAGPYDAPQLQPPPTRLPPPVRAHPSWRQTTGGPIPVPGGPPPGLPPGAQTGNHPGMVPPPELAATSVDLPAATTKANSDPGLMARLMKKPRTWAIAAGAGLVAVGAFAVMPTTRDHTINVFSPNYLYNKSATANALPGWSLAGPDDAIGELLRKHLSDVQTTLVNPDIQAPPVGKADTNMLYHDKQPQIPQILFLVLGVALPATSGAVAPLSTAEFNHDYDQYSLNAKGNGHTVLPADPANFKDDEVIVDYDVNKAWITYANAAAKQVQPTSIPTFLQQYVDQLLQTSGISKHNAAPFGNAAYDLYNQWNDKTSKRFMKLLQGSVYKADIDRANSG